MFFAGYQKEMQLMLSSDPGIESGIRFTPEFPDYSREELAEILVLFATNEGYDIDESSSDALFSIRLDESLIDGVVVKEGRIYLGNSERLIFKFSSA